MWSLLEDSVKSVCFEKPLSFKNLDILTLSQKIEQGYSPVLNHVGFSRNEDSKKSGGLVRGSWKEQRQEGSALLIRFVSGSKPPDPKYKSYFHLKNHHDRLFVVDLEAAQNSLEFCQSANGSVVCYDTVPSEFLTKIINIKDGTERVEQAQSTKENGH